MVKKHAAEKILTMSQEQLRCAKKLIRSQCANYDHGNCIFLEDGYETCICPQLISYTVLCKWFRTAVLPLDTKLQAGIMVSEHLRGCKDCSQTFVARSNSALYCDECAKKRKLQAKRDWWRRKRG